MIFHPENECFKLDKNKDKHLTWYTDEYYGSGSDTSDSDVTTWMNFNELKIKSTPLHMHNYWKLLTSQVEELERTSKRIYHITFNTMQKIGIRKQHRAVTFTLTSNHTEKDRKNCQRQPHYTFEQQYWKRANKN